MHSHFLEKPWGLALEWAKTVRIHPRSDSLEGVNRCRDSAKKGGLVIAQARMGLGGGGVWFFFGKNIFQGDFSKLFFCPGDILGWQKKTRFYSVNFASRQKSRFYSVNFASTKKTRFYSVNFASRQKTRFYSVNFASTQKTRFYSVNFASTKKSRFYSVNFASRQKSRFYSVNFASRQKTRSPPANFTPLGATRTSIWAPNCIGFSLSLRAWYVPLEFIRGTRNKNENRLQDHGALGVWRAFFWHIWGHFWAPNCIRFWILFRVR